LVVKTGSGFNYFKKKQNFCKVGDSMLNHIAYRNSKLFYNKEGTGRKAILLFHGFGQNHQAFAVWVGALKNDYTIYAFDLFFHGESYWPNRHPLKKKDWKEILELFFGREEIDTFEVAGFSLGGKFALATVEAFPSKVKKIILLAPDGIKTSFWYSLATYPIAIRALFKSMILHPGRLYRMAKILRSLGFVDRGLLRFAESQMDTLEKRKRVYFSWVYFRHLKFAITELAALINSNHIPLTLIAGKHDKVIVAQEMSLILDQVNDYNYKILETGHNGVIDMSISFLWPATDLT
jgi:pimeloyl-ACP methyl ester carboxylesterase